MSTPLHGSDGSDFYPDGYVPDDGAWDDHVWEVTCERFGTDEPTTDQLNTIDEELRRPY